MPKKITKISFYNYKAFYSITEDVYTLDLKDGKNLLIYGENGSGKSSVFEGLRDFFFSSSYNNLEFIQNKFSEGNIPKEPFIEVTFSDDPQSYYFSTDEYKTNNRVDFIQDTNKVKSFLSYKNLLDIHYFKSPSDVNIFDILFGSRGILCDLVNPSGNSSSETDTPFGKLFNRINQYSSVRRYSSLYKLLQSTPSILDDFNLGVKTILESVIINANKILDQFDQCFLIRSFEYIPLSFKDVKEKENRIKGGIIKPHIYFYGKEISDYNVFLNEARLTALSLAIYFSAIKMIPSTKYQIIFLDDIFIGIDMSNRIPLLNILKNEFSNQFQVLMTSYDRYWFEVAKEQLGTEKWYTAEMYVKINSENFQPVIIQPSKDYYELARKHFDAYDYPACGNYQRKACEECIKQFIPRNMQLQENEDGTISEVNDLETLFNALKKYLVANSLDITPFRDFGLYKRLVLNKLSHDDLKSPYYKAELEKMFFILDELRKLKREVILNTDEFIYFETIDSSGQSIKFDIKANDNLVLVRQGSIKKFQKCIFVTVNIHTNGIRSDFPSSDGDLKDIYDNICHHLSITPLAEIAGQFKDKNGKLLSSF
jgi:energy-coupling factor transporter ATP-binding protein EcfA2